jgi:hypothetical protein
MAAYPRVPVLMKLPFDFYTRFECIFSKLHSSRENKVEVVHTQNKEAKGGGSLFFTRLECSFSSSLFYSVVLVLHSFRV